MERENKSNKTLEAAQRRYNNSAAAPTPSDRSATTASNTSDVRRSKRPRAPSDGDANSDGDHGSFHHNGQLQGYVPPAQDPRRRQPECQASADPRPSLKSRAVPTAFHATRQQETSPRSAAQKTAEDQPDQMISPSIAASSSIATQNDTRHTPGGAGCASEPRRTASNIRSPIDGSKVVQFPTITGPPVSSRDGLAAQSALPGGGNPIAQATTEGAQASGVKSTLLPPPAPPALPATDQAAFILESSSAPPEAGTAESNDHATIAATVPGFNPSYIMPNGISLEQARHQYVVGISQWTTFIYQHLVQNAQAETNLATWMRETSSQVGRLIERLDAIEQRRKDDSNEVATLKKDFNAFRDRLRNA
ncbi:hypothetical protein BDV12DRAFT_70067 [Aspergillus spectabilis]